MDNLFASVPKPLQQYVIQNFRIVKEQSGFPAYVGLRGSDLYLGINVPLWEQLSADDRQKLLLHEIAHVLRGDLLVNNVNHTLHNIATDSIINEVLDIDAVGEHDGIRYSHIYKDLNLPDKLSAIGWRAIYNALLEKAKENGGIGRLGFDEIKETDNSLEAQEKVIEARIEAEGIEDIQKNIKDAGHFEMSSQKYTHYEVKIKQDTRIASIFSAIRARHDANVRLRRKTWRREGVYEGLRGLSRVPTLSVLVIIDVSGSFTEYIKLALGITSGLKDFQVDVGVFADRFAMVNNLNDLPDVGGGTYFSSVVPPKPYDVWVVITDGYFSDTPQLPNHPIVWVIPKGDQERFKLARPFDIVLDLKKDEK